MAQLRDSVTQSLDSDPVGGWEGQNGHAKAGDDLDAGRQGGLLRVKRRP